MGGTKRESEHEDQATLPECHGLEKPKPNKYDREIVDKYTGEKITVDVYSVLNEFGVQNSALQHLIKKALAVGARGHKTKNQDLDDIIASSKRAKELENGR